jgi:hypothetical protein
MSDKSKKPKTAIQMMVEHHPGFDASDNDNVLLTIDAMEDYAQQQVELALSEKDKEIERLNKEYSAQTTQYKKDIAEWGTQFDCYRKEIEGLKEEKLELVGDLQVENYHLIEANKEVERLKDENKRLSERALTKEGATKLLRKHYRPAFVKELADGKGEWIDVLDIDKCAASLSGLIPAEESKQWKDFDKQMDDGLYVAQTMSGETYLSTYLDGEWDVDYLNANTPDYVIPISFPPPPKNS